MNVPEYLFRGRKTQLTWSQGDGYRITRIADGFRAVVGPWILAEVDAAAQAGAKAVDHLLTRFVS